ncbi:hypothetical protein AGMMS5026_05900 [Endomicrobiia bacterium]|nr:hypothetical protein AGMMS49523_09580 [Endomicrobiia bacterium]GHT12953.1 hypothetical protein AGMMS49571_05830 [Endomicrobiia bacterium]GHT18550.1 hypothetical protein AGMMS49929_00460 [Endomicrobiia bacterium]GHT28663.1 hypothetical protein AGMMS49995_09870 [Endomicrobiia bacterium]GHT30793.1 hypothetical protein AGMMS5026_05900 [Endomicrobiia bacterium]
MKIYVEKIIIKNRAPFDKLSLDFKENEIAVLMAVNGNGKTTLLSYIADAWYEMAKSFFQNEFEGKQNKYYRFSSSAFNIDKNQPSFVYIRFKTKTYEEQCKYYIDYVDIREKCTQDQYSYTIRRKNIF